MMLQSDYFHVSKLEEKLPLSNKGHKTINRDAIIKVLYFFVYMCVCVCGRERERERERKREVNRDRECNDYLYLAHSIC